MVFSPNTVSLLRSSHNNAEEDERPMRDCLKKARHCWLLLHKRRRLVLQRVYSTLLEALFQIQDHKGADEQLLGAWTKEHIREEHHVSSLSVSERHSVDRSLSSKDDTHTHRHTSSICAVLIYCLFGMWCGVQLRGPRRVSACEARHCNHKGHPAAHPFSVNVWTAIARADA